LSNHSFLSFKPHNHRHHLLKIFYRLVSVLTFRITFPFNLIQSLTILVYRWYNFFNQIFWLRRRWISIIVQIVTELWDVRRISNDWSGVTRCFLVTLWVLSVRKVIVLWLALLWGRGLRFYNDFTVLSVSRRWSWCALA